MTVITSPHSDFSTQFFAPALDLIPSCKNQHVCPQLSDGDWLRLGVHRCLMRQPKSSGRGFLQTLASFAPQLSPGHSHFFESLKSSRRLRLCTELNTRLCERARAVLPDALSPFTALKGYEVYAGDGHFHGHAAHDEADTKGRKHATGHLYLRNLRTGMLSHLVTLDQVARKKEHDLRALNERVSPEALRQGAKKGQKVILAYDRAITDYKLWAKWKQSSGIYVITRAKENDSLLKCGDAPFDRANPLNAGVISDEFVGPRSHRETMLRRIKFYDVISGHVFTFLTNVLTLEVPPGVLALIYKMRWNIEKSFDEFKNKLGENKAWASSPTAKTMQAQFLCLSANLLTFFEHQIGTKEGIANEPEIKRRAQRLVKFRAVAKAQNTVLPQGLEMAQHMTQHALKFIRWVAAQLWLRIPWKEACAALKMLYANL